METHFIIIQICSLLGFVLSSYLLFQKSQNKKVICPFKDQCNDVLESQYSKVFGIPTMSIGVLYYMMMFCAFRYIDFDPSILQQIPTEFLLFISGTAVLFSFYQTAIQLFVLKKWCSWCLESTLLSTVIFIILFDVVL